MIKKEIVCLANSDMLGGRCIAGKDTSTGHWIRLVNRPGAGISDDECKCKDGKGPNLLDTIEVPLVVPYSHFHHSENWLLAPDVPWIRKRRVAVWSDLAGLADDPKDLWEFEPEILDLEDLEGDSFNENDTSESMEVSASQCLSGTDRVPFCKIKDYSCSLYLIQVQDMVLHVEWKKKDRWKKDQKQVDGRFSYNDRSYSLRVTDPKIKMDYGNKSVGEYPLGECYVTVSLAESPVYSKLIFIGLTGNQVPWHYFKLIAAIITPDQI